MATDPIPAVEPVSNVAGPELQEAAQSVSTQETSSQPGVGVGADPPQSTPLGPPPAQMTPPTISPGRSIVFGEHRATMQELMDAYRAQTDNEEMAEKGRLFQQMEQGDAAALQQYVASLTPGEPGQPASSGGEVETSIASLQEQISGVQSTLASQAVQGFTNEVGSMINNGNFPHLRMLPGIGQQIVDQLLAANQTNPNFQLNADSFSSYMQNCEKWATGLTQSVHDQFQAQAQAPGIPATPTGPSLPGVQPGGAPPAQPFPGQLRQPTNVVPPLGGASPGVNPGPVRPNAARNEKGWNQHIAAKLAEITGQQTV